MNLPANHTFEHDGTTGLLQLPSGVILAEELVTPDLAGDAPFCEFNLGEEKLIIACLDQELICHKV